jgi:hypothetical protein
VSTLLAILLAASPMTVPTNWYVAGPGLQTCGQWTREKDDNKTVHLATKAAWLGGVSTGYNLNERLRSETKQVAASPLDMVTWMDDYCTKHPFEKVGNAVVILFSQLLSKSGL